jgi:hypothetical protein
MRVRWIFLIIVIIIVVLSCGFVLNEAIPAIMENRKGVFNENGMMIEFGNVGTTILTSNGGYSRYKIGDIVLVSTGKEPLRSSMVYYNYRTDSRISGFFGPDYYLKKVIGLPGDTVVFEFDEDTYEVNNKRFSLEERLAYPDSVEIRKGFDATQLVWGNEIYNISDLKGTGQQLVLEVPAGEYLIDQIIYGGVITIKQESTQGVVLMKIGHSFWFENRQRRVVY